MKISSALQENETAMDAVKKLMESLQPVFDVLSGVLEGIAQGLSKAVEWLVQFVGESDGVKKVVSSIIGVGNSIFQYLLAPIKSAVAAFKGLGKIIGDVFKGDWSEIKNHAKETGQEIADAYKEGFSFKSNFETGKAAGTDFINGVKDNKESAKQAGKEVASSFREGYDEELERIKAELAEEAEIMAALAEEEEFQRQYEEELAAQEAFQQEQNDLFWQGLSDRLDAQEAAKAREAELEKAVADGVTEYLNEQEEIRKKKAEETAQARIDTMFAVADATSSILGSIADMYEADEENAEKNAKKIKALRIAEATINTISGAIGAFMQATSTMPPPFGAIVGAAQAAAVTAAGIAQIAQMKKTSMTSAGAISSPNAVVSAPTSESTVPSVRSVTSATEEERLNQMAKDQKVYILSSDIEASLDGNKTRVEESSF
jgi:phage-related protein